ncbi:MAG: hypothetical protein AB4426_13035 [Xenococcaceae cyanobacterium]
MDYDYFLGESEARVRSPSKLLFSIESDRLGERRSDRAVEVRKLGSTEPSMLN